MAHVVSGALNAFVPCEVQSIDTTGNYRAMWDAYAREAARIPKSSHGMNWANVSKRLISQLILKGAIASSSSLCTRGFYFVVPDRVYDRFERLIGKVEEVSGRGPGVLPVMTYGLGPEVPEGNIRSLVRQRKVRVMTTDFAKAFASGRELLLLGSQFDSKVTQVLAKL
jgi:hypothetical protein